MVEALQTICAAGADTGSLSAKATQSSTDDEPSSVTNRPAFGLPTGTAGSSDDDGDETTTATQTRSAGTQASSTAVSSSRSSAAGGLVQQPLSGVAAWVVNGLVAVAGYLVV